MCCFTFGNLTEARIIQEEGLLIEKLSPLDWCLGKSYGAFNWLMIGNEGHSPLWAVPFLSRWLRLHKIAWGSSHKKLDSKQCSSMAFKSLPASWFLSWFSFFGTLQWWNMNRTCKPSNTFLFRVIFGHDLHHSNRKVTNIPSNTTFIFYHVKVK